MSSTQVLVGIHVVKVQRVGLTAPQLSTLWDVSRLAFVDEADVVHCHSVGIGSVDVNANGDIACGGILELHAKVLRLLNLCCDGHFRIASK